MMSILIFFVGYLSEKRLLKHFSEEKVIRDHQRKYFSILFFILGIVLAVSFQKKPLFVWIILFNANFLSYFVPFLIQKRRKEEFESQAVEIIDSIVTTVKSGRSFREAIKRTQAENQSASFYFQEIFHAISLDQAPDRISSDAQVQRFYTELLQISKTQHRISDRLVSVRRILKTERWFKSKVKQALMQSRAQSIVMSILYLWLLGYVMGTGGLSGNLDLILFSAAIYFVGVVIIWNMGRNYQWKA